MFFISRLFSLGLLFAVALVPTVYAQVHVALHGDLAEASAYNGAGISVYFPIAEHRYEVVVGGTYFSTPTDSLQMYAIDLDFHVNLPVMLILRPYLGFGFAYLTFEDRGETSINLKAGLHLPPLFRRYYPYAQFVYRPPSSIDNRYFQAGFRIQLGAL